MSGCGECERGLSEYVEYMSECDKCERGLSDVPPSGILARVPVVD